MTSEFMIVLIYALIMVGIGLWSRKFSKSLDSFMLGDRQAGAWMSAFAYGTTYFSAVVFIGYAGRNGWSFGLWAVLIGVGNAVIGTYLAWRVMARRTRTVTNKLKLGTMPEYFGVRYQSKGMKTLAAVIIFVFMTPYAASVFSGLSYLFESVFHIPYFYAIVLMAVVSSAYLVLGGYIATLIADFVQGFIMLVGIVVMIGVLVNNPAIGGLVEGTKALFAQSANVALFDVSQPNNWISLVSLILLTSLGTWGLPQIIHKFYAIKDDQAVRRGTIVSTVFAFIISCGAYLVGALAKLFFTINPGDLPMVGSAIAFDQIVPKFLTSALPATLLGIVIVLVLSASITTLTGIVLVSSSSMTVDLISQLKPDLSKKQALSTTRVLCLVFVVVSVLIALTKSPIQMLMSFSWGTVSGAFIGPFLLGLYMKSITKAGAWAGMVGGLSLSLVLALASGFNAGQAPLFGVLAMLFSLLLTVVVSKFTRPFDQAHLAKIFE